MRMPFADRVAMRVRIEITVAGGLVVGMLRHDRLNIVILYQFRDGQNKRLFARTAGDFPAFAAKISP
mgnify:CR=1 FL=1